MGQDQTLDKAAAERRRLLYGRRHGHRLSVRQAARLNDTLPDLSVTLPAEAGAWLRPADLFQPGVRRFALEVGFGGGEHLAELAATRSDWGFIGCEPFVNGLVQLLAKIEAEGLANIRIHKGDARDVMERLAPASLDAVFVLFPDPWPKKRHWKRRFFGSDTLAVLSRIMKPGAELRLASDIQGYVQWSLVHILASGAFDWCAETARDWRDRPEDWPTTRYEAKALRAGRRPVYLRFRRRGPTGQSGA